MQISEIQILPIKSQDGLVAFASIVLNNQLFLGSIGIYKRLDGKGYRITYPTKKVGNKSINIFHPINKEAGAEIERTILDKAEQILGI